ncbi:hypothetical protein C453_12671 [Haloferax elongans ATCC BAA-1513]|uniref:Uncharacterized protein n=1 Tax=Haloferax elongans ATCC BAA-1513 TaxID=1230453 RepID=M0HMS2_HALEO|nr:hypothetical protein [Haloferax elongans]ELZ84399.1 hypothetical protein C453_12671 [Haloferax elongans ATCC BAA-1513]
MADEIFYEQGDDATEDNFGRVWGRPNIMDYVVRGLSLSDNGDGTATLTAGYATILDGIRGYHVYPDSRTVTLVDSGGVNHIYLAIDVDHTTTSKNNQVSVHVDADDTPPSLPNLKLGTVDASAGTATETNRNPDGTFENLEATRKLDMRGNPIDNQGVTSVADETALADGEPGLYRLEDTGDVVYFDGDTSTN